MKKKGITYRDAGVDIAAGESLVNKIKPLANKTRRPEVLDNLGGFAGLFALSGQYKNPILVSSTDGVGTKLIIALKTGKHSTIGIDLVAMCVNDIVVMGAQPLFFLDYLRAESYPSKLRQRLLREYLRVVLWQIVHCWEEKQRKCLECMNLVDMI